MKARCSAYVRNICAHHGRLYQKNMIMRPKVFIPEDSDIADNNRLFRILCCMRYLCYEYGDWESFVADFEDLLDEYRTIIKPSALGLSDGWKSKLLDQYSNSFIYGG